jgi:hypothetical protein
VHALFTLIRKIFGDIEVRVLSRLDQICVDFESKSPEVAVVYSSTFNDLFPDVFSESFDDKVKLRLGIKGLDRFTGPWLGGLMLSGVVLSVAYDPTSKETYQV